jgi:hypothetical protein
MTSISLFRESISLPTISAIFDCIYQMKLSRPLIYDTILPIKMSFPSGACAFSCIFPPRDGRPVTM